MPPPFARRCIHYVCVHHHMFIVDTPLCHATETRCHQCDRYNTTPPSWTPQSIASPTSQVQLPHAAPRGERCLRPARNMSMISPERFWRDRELRHRPPPKPSGGPTRRPSSGPAYPPIAPRRRQQPTSRAGRWLRIFPYQIHRILLRLRFHISALLKRRTPLSVDVVVKAAVASLHVEIGRAHV